MRLRSRPASKPFEHLIYLKDKTSDIAKISFQRRSAKILAKSGLKLSTMPYHRSLETSKLPEPEINVQRFSGQKELTLAINNCFYLRFAVHNLTLSINCLMINELLLRFIV